MGCNCGGGTVSAQHVLVKSDGTEVPYLTRTEAVAAMSTEPGSRVVRKSA
jgi:hypothetical protein